MVVLRKSLLDTLMQIFIMIRHLVAEISRFKFDDYRVIGTGASDLKPFFGAVYMTISSSAQFCIHRMALASYLVNGDKTSLCKGLRPLIGANFVTDYLFTYHYDVTIVIILFTPNEQMWMPYDTALPLNRWANCTTLWTKMISIHALII